jgi:hypothetical protein
MASDEPRDVGGPNDRPNEIPVDEVEDDPEAPLYSSVPLETEDGIVVVQQQTVGPGNEEGGGEWPDPHTPPRLPAPGAARRDRGDDRVQEVEDGHATRARQQPRQRP